jgi:hypothetical protein
MGLTELIIWLNGLPLALAMRRTMWVIPLIQTLHILSIGMILSSVIMLDLRVWGIARGQTLVQSAHRYVPWIWWSMLVATVTGIVLIMVGSRRALLDASFMAKMQLMVVAMLVTIAFQVAMYRNNAGEGARSGPLVSLIAAVTLLLWIVVTLAGRARWMTALFR